MDGAPDAATNPAVAPAGTTAAALLESPSLPRRESRCGTIIAAGDDGMHKAGGADRSPVLVLAREIASHDGGAARTRGRPGRLLRRGGVW